LAVFIPDGGMAVEKLKVLTREASGEGGKGLTA
jgi:hypothetical protein